MKAALRRGWTLVSANYRTIPESTGLDLAEDVLDAFRYVSSSGQNSLSHDLNIPGLVDPSRIIIAGSSGGGYCAAIGTLEVLKQATAKPDFPKPAATLIIYPMLDLLSPHWICKGIDLDLSDEDAEAGRKDLERRLASKEVSFGERFNDDIDISHHTRWNLLRYLIKVPLFVDYFTGVNGLSEKLIAAASTSDSAYEDAKKELVPTKERGLFILDFDNLRSDMPPLFVIHGAADAWVPVAESDKLVEKAKSLGVPTSYWRLEGLGHDFDLPYPDLEDPEQEPPEVDSLGQNAVKEFLQKIDKLVRI